ncbi:hypothetical protein PSPO01_12415 [Paraphaeosphaeria sporulosa]
MKQQALEFYVDGQNFTVHEDLIKQASSSWEPESLLRLPRGPWSGHELRGIPAWGFRGFVHWIYNNELPKEAMLKANRWCAAWLLGSITFVGSWSMTISRMRLSLTSSAHMRAVRLSPTVSG